LGFTDDISFLCLSLNQLSQVIDLLELESSKIGLIINKKKSTIIEIYCRKYARPHWNLAVGKEYKGIPIVNEYPDLGTPINQKLDADKSFLKIKTSVLHSLKQLAPLLIKSDIDFKISIWKTFVSPHLEMGAIPYIYSNKNTAQTKIDKFIKQSIKMCLNSPAKGDDKYLGHLFPNTWRERCLYFKRRSLIKWKTRNGENNIQIPK